MSTNTTQDPPPDAISRSLLFHLALMADTRAQTAAIAVRIARYARKATPTVVLVDQAELAPRNWPVISQQELDSAEEIATWCQVVQGALHPPLRPFFVKSYELALALE